MTIYTLDFETYWAAGYSLTNISNFEYVMDPKFRAHGLAVQEDDGDPYWITHEDIPGFLNSVDWKGSTVVCQNSYFDMSILVWVYNWDFEAPKLLADTRGMALLTTKALINSASLDGVSRFRLKERKIQDALIQTKEVEVLPPDLEETFIPYALKDVELTYRIYMDMLDECPEIEMELIDLHLRLYFRNRAMISSENLVRILGEDRKVREGLVKQAKEAWPTLFGEVEGEEDLFKLIRKDSKSVIAEAAKLEGKFVPKKRNKAGKVIPAVAKDDLDFQVMCAGNERLTLLRDITMKAGSNLIQTRATRLMRMNNYFGGWAHPLLQYHGAHTGRSSGGDKLNFQNVPKQLRSAIIAPPGQSIIIADSSNIEARVLAWLAGQLDVLDICSEADAIDRSGGSAKDLGKDIYTSMGKKIGTQDRALGKLVVLGCGFGMSLKTFIFNSRIYGLSYSDNELSNAFYGWRSANGAIVNFWDTIWDMFTTAALHRLSATHDKFHFEPYKQGTALELPSGRRMLYPAVHRQGNKYVGAFKQKYWSGMVTENICQAVARDVVFYQAMESDRIKDRLFLLIHDELDMIEEDSKAEDLYTHACEALSTPLDWCKDLPLNGGGGIVKEFTKL